MPNTQQAKKRLRQGDVRNLRNRTVKSEIKTHTKHVLAAIEAGDREKAQECLKTVHSKLDKAVRKGVLHRNTVDRRKGLLARKIAATT